MKKTGVVGSRVSGQNAWADRGIEENKCGRVAEKMLTGAVGAQQTEKKRRFMAAENDSRKDKMEKKRQKKVSGVAKTVARVLPLACANEHLLRRMDSLVAVQ